MKSLKNRSKRFLSFALALLMVVSTIFVSNVQAKAETGTTYEPYYDAETQQVVGLPEIGSVLKPTDCIKGSDTLSENTAIVLHVYSIKEEISDAEEDWSSCPSPYVGKGGTISIGELSPLISSAEKGFTIEKTEYWKYGNNEQIDIYLCAVDQAKKVETLELELDWSKIEAEIGGTLSLDTFKEGFIKNEIVDEASVRYYECIYIDKPDGTTEYEESCIINADDTYTFELVYSLEKGYYFNEKAEDDIVFSDTLAEDAFHWNHNSNVWATNLSITFKFTGEELIEKVEAAKNPVTPPVEDDEDDKDPVTPPTEDGKDENESSELMDVFNKAIFEFYEFFVGIELTDESTNYFEEGQEIHPYAEGTAQYIDEGRSWWVSCAWIDGQNGVVIHLIDLNDKSKSDEIVAKYGDWEYYQSYPTEAFQYHNGEYVIWAVIPEEYIAQGITFDVLKSYLDTYYNEATNPVVEENDYAANIANKNEVAEKIELTEAEKKAIENGGELEVILTFKDNGAEATTEEQKAIAEVLEDKKVGTFLEIDLTKKIGAYEAVVSETTGMVAITFELPETLKNTAANVERTYSVVRYHDGKVEVLDATYDEATGTITFETDKFSTYAVVYEDVAVKAPETTPERIPTTGDATNIAFYVVLLVCGAGLFVVSKKQNFA